MHAHAEEGGADTETTVGKKERQMGEVSFALDIFFL